jgi:outer membrane lipoprotein SlyB
MRTKTILSLVVVIALVLVGCGASTAIENLQLAVDAVTAALPIIGTISGIPPATITRVTTYLDATNQALAQSASILAAPGTDAQKTAQIVGAFAGIAEPVVPPQYAAIAGLVQTIARDVASFIASLPPATATTTTALSADQRARLAKIAARAKTNRESLAHMMHGI